MPITYASASYSCSNVMVYLRSGAVHGAVHAAARSRVAVMSLVGLGERAKSKEGAGAWALARSRVRVLVVMESQTRGMGM